jgi:CTP synthase (UTP-ammonia lyase)
MSFVNPILNDISIREIAILKKDYIQFQGDLSSYLITLENRIALLEKYNIQLENVYTRLENKYIDLESSYKIALETSRKQLEIIENRHKELLVEKPDIVAEEQPKKKVEENLNVLASSNRYHALGWKNVKNKRKK